MAHVLVTHSDEPIGRRVVKTLVHDEDVESILALGSGTPPRAFDRFLSGNPPKLSYVRIDMAKHRPVSDFFHSSRFREASIDTLIYVPQHGVSDGASLPMVAGLPPRTAEARLVLQNCLEASSIRSVIALGSAFVYRLQPGNANRLDEESELDLDPEVQPEVRSWIDSDMLFHSEIGNQRIRVVLLRAPTVVATGGFIYMNPWLSGSPGLRLRPLGFDPLCALVSDKDVAKAIQSAVHTEHPGIFNVAGAQAIPLSVLGRWTGRPSLSVPRGFLRAASSASHWLGADTPRTRDCPQLRYGFTLDTTRAERELGFRPQYQIGLSRAGDGGLRLETSPA